MKTIEKLPYLISIVLCFYGATTGRAGFVRFASRPVLSAARAASEPNPPSRAAKPPFEIGLLPVEEESLGVEPADTRENLPAYGKTGALNHGAVERSGAGLDHRRQKIVLQEPLPTNHAVGDGVLNESAEDARIDGGG